MIDSTAASTSAATKDQSVPGFISDFDELIDTDVKNFIERSKSLGGLVAEQATIVSAAFAHQRHFLLISSNMKKPDVSTLEELLRPTQGDVQTIIDIREAGRGTSVFNHISAVSVSISVLAWVTCEAKPHLQIKKTLESAQYWGNRVLSEFKNKDARHIEWLQAYYQIFNALANYTQEHFIWGIQWAPTGIDAREIVKTMVPKSTEEVVDVKLVIHVSSQNPSSTKMPNLRRSKKIARIELVKQMWILENFESQTLEIEASISHSILISNCNESTIHIKSKANAVSVDGSSRLSVMIDSLVSSFDVIKSPNFAMQVLGTLPIVLLDQVDGAEIYLGENSLSTEIYSSKCGGINLYLQRGEEEYEEIPIPQQIRTAMGSDGRVESKIVKYSG
ncbi:hypothetical protein BP5796_03778 [Coleophoma crateriformis]|uniref:Adenylyl cyclase-associated protein n=1 Tax=Coleophoma crateriformis TaxID=565419 RepID=A0A3D8SGN9_9HELO|nr:hypothetical protein BP5796_03778 [Coleophoma crateriformis]